MYVLEKTFLSCETCVLSNCFLLNNKICLKYKTKTKTAKQKETKTKKKTKTNKKKNKRQDSPPPQQITNTQHNTKRCATRTPQKPEMNSGAHEGFLCLIKHPLCY